MDFLSNSTWCGHWRDPTNRNTNRYQTRGAYANTPVIIKQRLGLARANWLKQMVEAPPSVDRNSLQRGLPGAVEQGNENFTGHQLAEMEFAIDRRVIGSVKLVIAQAIPVVEKIC
jgi:hypothetical protein